MLLVIDAGNTNTVFALFEGDTLLGQWRMATDAKRTADEYAVWLLQLMQLEQIDRKKIKAVVLGSVVPQTNFNFRKLARQYFKCELIQVGAPDVKVGIEAKIDRPAEVGADRLVNALAAWKRYRKPLIIVDFGTATTFDVVDGKGNYIGGVIAPGVSLSLEALHRAAAKLPNVDVMRPAKVIGTATVPAIQSGIYWGYVGLVEGILDRIMKEYGKKMHVISTGGLSSLFSRATSKINQHEPDLTIYGLKEVYKLNQAR